MKITINEKKIENVVSSCHFDKLSETEKKEGFPESAIMSQIGGQSVSTSGGQCGSTHDENWRQRRFQPPDSRNVIDQRH